MIKSHSPDVEELSPEQIRNQIETRLFGPMNVTRASLPVMRKQRSGLLLTLSSTAGIAGQMFCAAYAAAKFGIEGWIASLTPEIAPFGIRTMLVEPGFFRAELLSTQSTTYAKPSIDDYAERTRETVTAQSMNSTTGTAVAASMLCRDNPPTLLRQSHPAPAQQATNISEAFLTALLRRIHQARELYDRGVGYVDAHLLAAAVIEGCQLWTRDRRLHALAATLGVAVN